YFTQQALMLREVGAYRKPFHQLAARLSHMAGLYRSRSPRMLRILDSISARWDPWEITMMGLTAVSIIGVIAVRLHGLSGMPKMTWIGAEVGALFFGLAV